jgi:thiamine-phosphate pyrophosphorylase
VIARPLPPLYAILDAERCVRQGLSLLQVAEAWRDAGVRLIQYRDKPGSDAEVLRNAFALRSVFPEGETTLILNDRVHLFAASGFDGVHVGQTDLTAGRVRELIGAEAVLGISTHNPEQLRAADGLPVDYVAVGPVYATGTKVDADPVVGIEGVRVARALTRKPLVAIGGITLDRVDDVMIAGADAVAVISALLVGDLGETALEFLATVEADL